MLVFRRSLSDITPVENVTDIGITFVINAIPGGEELSSRNVPVSLAALVHEARTEQQIHLLYEGSTVVGWGASAVRVRRWPISETQTDIVLGEGDCVMTSFEVLETYRRRGLYLRMLAELLHHHAACGNQIAWIWCYEENVASRRAIERLGFTLSQKHELRRFCGARRSRIANL